MEFVYRGLKADHTRHIVTESEVERQLDRLRQQNPRIEVVNDRPARSGDEIVLDYAGYCNGVQFAGGTAEKQTLVLGSGTFIPGFEEQLIDKVPGEKVNVHVTFPEQYHSEELAGKEAEFRCVIHEIRIKSAYELDDNFAKEFGGCDTLDEMRKKLTETMQKFTDERGEMDLQDRLLRKAAETIDVSIGEEELEAAIDEQMNTLKAQLGQQGLSVEMYCQFMNTSVEQLRKDAKSSAEESIRTKAAVARIVELEQLEASEEEIADALLVICRQNRMTMEQLKPYYNEEFRQAVINSVLTSKATRLIRDAAEVNVITGA